MRTPGIGDVVKSSSGFTPHFSTGIHVDVNYFLHDFIDYCTGEYWVPGQVDRANKKRGDTRIVLPAHLRGFMYDIHPYWDELPKYTWDMGRTTNGEFNGSFIDSLDDGGVSSCLTEESLYIHQQGFECLRSMFEAHRQELKAWITHLYIVGLQTKSISKQELTDLIEVFGEGSWLRNSRVRIENLDVYNEQFAL